MMLHKFLKKKASMSIIETYLKIFSYIDPKDLRTLEANFNAWKISGDCSSLKELTERRQELEAKYLGSDSKDPLIEKTIPFLRELEMDVATGRKSLQKPISV